jgi:hypothetical protein
MALRGCVSVAELGRHFLQGRSATMLTKPPRVVQLPVG